MLQYSHADTTIHELKVIRLLLAHHSYEDIQAARVDQPTHVKINYAAMNELLTRPKALPEPPADTQSMYVQMVARQLREVGHSQEAIAAAMEGRPFTVIKDIKAMKLVMAEKPTL